MLSNLKYIQEDQVLISKDWLENTSNLIQTFTRKKGVKKNYITRVVKSCYNKDKFNYQNFNDEDIVFVSRYIECFKAFEIDYREYVSIPVLQVLGAFRNNIISLDNLEIFDDKVLLEEIEDAQENNMIKIPDSKVGSLGRVVKTGKGGFNHKGERKENPIVNSGDSVLYWNNTTTNILLHGKTYQCLEDNRIIGKFEGDLTIENLKMFDNCILLQDTLNDKVHDGSILLACDDDSDWDERSIQRNIFEVLHVGENSEGVEVGQKIVSNMDTLDYVDFKGKRYYTVSDIAELECILG